MCSDLRKESAGTSLVIAPAGFDERTFEPVNDQYPSSPPPSATLSPRPGCRRARCTKRGSRCEKESRCHGGRCGCDVDDRCRTHLPAGRPHRGGPGHRHPGNGRVGPRPCRRAWTETLLVLVSPSTALVGACTLAAIAGALRGGRAAALVLTTAAGTAAGAVVLKATFVRPQLLDAAANSLPSGHVAVVAGLAAAAAMIATPASRHGSSAPDLPRPSSPASPPWP